MSTYTINGTSVFCIMMCSSNLSENSKTKICYNVIVSAVLTFLN